MNLLQYNLFCDMIMSAKKRGIDMDKNLLNRMNELAKKKREQGLTPEEQAEQKKLYKIYLGEIRTQFDKTLDNVSVKEKNGEVVPFKQAYKKNK